MKKCPFCDEMIANNATSCKFCWEELVIEQEPKEDHLNLTIKNFWKKKNLFKSIIRYWISIIFILAWWITYANAYGTSEINGILLIISWAVWLYVATLLP